MLDNNTSIAFTSIDYSKLQELLEAGNWAKADNETLAILLKLAGLENEDKLDVEHIEKISESDLKAIDQLWVNCSNGHFGFSVQKSLYRQDISSLCSQVEWIRVEPQYYANQERLYTTISQGRFYIRISYDNAKQKGHLPACILSSALRHNPLVSGYCSWGHPIGGGKRKSAEFYIDRWCETHLEVLKHIHSLL
jgi:hypothetical protein